MRPTRPIRILLVLSPLFLAAWMACPPPPPPPPPPGGDTTTAKKLVEGEIGLVEAQADGGFGSPIRLPDGGVVTPTGVNWCMYYVDGPPGGAACFTVRSHICIMCPPTNCPQSLALATVPNLPQSGNPAKLGCDMKINKSPNAWACGACDPTDDTGGVLGAFGGYFRF